MQYASNTLWAVEQFWYSHPLKVPSDVFCLFLQLTYLPTYLLTYSMVQSPSWEANWFAASQEITRISLNPKVHYRTHKRPPPVSILGQPNPIHTPTSHLLEIHPNIINPSTRRSPQCSPSLRFPHQDPIQPPLLTDTRHMPSPSHSLRFYLLGATLWICKSGKYEPAKCYECVYQMPVTVYTSPSYVNFLR